MIAYFCTIYNNKCNVNLCTIPYLKKRALPNGNAYGVDGNEKKKVGGAQTDCVPYTFTG